MAIVIVSTNRVVIVTPRGGRVPCYEHSILDSFAPPKAHWACGSPADTITLDSTGGGRSQHTHDAARMSCTRIARVRAT
jgi:hypothetical protein